MKQPVLLCYNLNEDKARGVRMAATRLKIRVRRVEAQEYALPLAVLCGLESAAQEAAQMDTVTEPAEGTAAFADEMLVMALFPPGMMELFLQTMRRMGVTSIALKAVLTPTNAAWSSAWLRDELSREREAIRAGQEAAHMNP